MPKTLALRPNQDYIFIDAIYTDNFQRADERGLRHTGLAELQPLLFPYTDDPYALFRADAPVFDLARIQYEDDAEGAPAGLHHFCSDSGLILVVEVGVWWDFLGAFDAEKFVFDYLENPTTRFRWDPFMARFANHFQWFYTAEVHEDFAGGGSFRIETS
jgi:hypothetical protein